MMPKPHLYILCGLPFSGKSTLARALVSQYSFVHLDLDALAQQAGFSPGDGMSEEQWGTLFYDAYQQAEALLRSGNSVVFDAVNFNRAGRDRLCQIAQQVGCEAYIIYLDIRYAELEQRRQANQLRQVRPAVRDEDFTQLAEAFEVPTADENVRTYHGRIPMASWVEQLCLGAK